MADRSAIEWTDATVNFWWGCTKVGPGCDHCYAETWDKRTGGEHWGHGVPRRKIEGAVKLIHRLDNQYADFAADWHVADGNALAFGLARPRPGYKRRVFIQSMSDLFDLEVPVEWFAESWHHIKDCNRIETQIVTKRISAVEKRLAEIGETTWPKHAGLIVTVVNQAEADRDVPRLLDLKAKLGIPWVGLSCEPLLGSIVLHPLACGTNALTSRTGPNLDWVIAGGESGKDARPMSPDWASSLRDQCSAADVPFLFKQWGEYRPCSSEELDSACGAVLVGESGECSIYCDDERHVGHSGWYMRRVGKKAAGRLLDGVEHNGFPKVPA